MGHIREKDLSDGSTRFYAEVQLKGFPRLTATFSRKSDAKLWIQKTESELRCGRNQLIADLWRLKEAVKNKELKHKPDSVSGVDRLEKTIRFLDNSSGVELLLFNNPWGEESISLADFLEWMINTGIPLPEIVHQKIGIAPLVDTTFESYWKRKKRDLFARDKHIRPISKPRCERLQQRTAT